MITKICGIKNKETLLCCEKKGVNFFGMIFYKKSPRNISRHNAIQLQKLSQNLNINGVGVFVNESLIEIRKFIKDLNLKFVQLHGDENNDYIKTIKKEGVKIIKKVSIQNRMDLKTIDNYYDTDYLLFDYKAEINELPGGNSKSFDWNLIKDLKTSKPWFLSGGINLNNIELIRTKIHPFGVDLSSGVEKELGIKDNHIINNFMDKLNNA